ncbi:putative leucine-rich repeat-containing protein DDB_G0290503 [Colletes gigas]|uniref:putative leucine-rich repeat-containing protein DDB_G0290503 n=1 Tax=Colletes gigas TaxID=935657 RepID=UPI001C9B9435|nr:putative leucine-rich repeat-containing protein DDB_G0290503 [Colletes gigas]
MLDTEQDNVLKQGTERDIILEEHQTIVEDLKRDLELCKVEQNNIRTELEILQNESPKINDIHESFNRIRKEECNSQDTYKKEIANLQECITLLESEKDSVQQLWHISLNTVSALEEELKRLRTDEKSTQFYQEHANAIKESYSEAIKMLEEKLSQTKNNFVKQQMLYQTSKEKVENLSKEKNELLEKFESLQKDAQDKDRNNQVMIETLKKELAYTKAETNKIVQTKLDLEKKLNEVKRYADNIMVKDKETKNKMAEAIELIESAVREKDLVLHREVLVLEEKARVEHQLSLIANEYDAKIRELNKKTQEEIELSTNKYLTEIKELKIELREKTALVEKTQRELKFAEEALCKIRKDCDVKILDYEQKIKRLELQLQVYDETIAKNRYDIEIKQLKEKITTLEGGLVTSNNKLQKLEQHSIEDQIKKADRENKDITKQYSDLESQLTKTLGVKENLVLQLKSLKSDFDYEIQKRDNERHSLENKIHELEINLQKRNCTKESKLQDALADETNPYMPDTKQKRTLDITVENKCHCCQMVFSDHMNKLQEKFDKKTKELIYHVQVHQKLSKKWRDETKLLTAKFQRKTKELKCKLSTLQKENHELSTELLTCKQQMAQHTLQDIQRFNVANEIR